MIKSEYYKDLAGMNTFGMKVKARCFVEYDSVADLVDIEFEELARPVLHIGGGSNLLFTDDFKGTVLHSKIDFIEILEDVPAGISDGTNSGEVLVSAGSGVVFDDLCAWAAREGLWGLENLSHIPGEVGASAVQNIGAYGVEVKDVIKTVYCYDTVEEEFVRFGVADCKYGYRDSWFKNPEIKGRYIVTHVVFSLSRSPQPKLDYGHIKGAVLASAGLGETATEEEIKAVLTPSAIRKVIIKTRKEKLPEPSVMGSAGSFFKNPVMTREHFTKIEAAAKAEHGADCKVPHYIVPGTPAAAGSAPVEDLIKVPAAWMIEQCGWKGRRSGGAAVYEKQPLVIVNYTGEAYPEEIIGLERRIISSVKEKFGVELHPEVEHI